MPSGFFFGRLRSYVRYDGDAVINFAGAVTYLANGAVGNTKYSGIYLVGTTTAEMNISYGYTYNEDGSLSMLQIESNSASGESALTYDKFGRLTQAETTFDSSSNTTIDFSMQKAYTYLTEGGAATGLVSTYTTTVGGVARTYTFTYDVNGNITKIVDSAGYTCRYVYDDLGQLIREDDGYTNHTYLYTYDKAGNIIKKETYNYTAAGITPTLGGSSISYTYGSTNGWGDQLTSFGGNAITYDANGNPVLYYNGYNFTWANGTELVGATNSTYNLSFSYDDNGVRVRKVVNGVEHIYTVNGTQILTESWVADQVEHLLVYLYDASGSPIGMEYRNSTYAEGVFEPFFFETNLQGDIIAVYNKLGTKVISYTYDAWGNCSTISTGAAGSDLAGLNPFRYRGYYYDTETGLYYVSSRYYDPEIGRWINEDSQLNTSLGILGLNQFSYCLNNPVNMVDYGGNKPGDLFDTMDEAARDFAEYINAKSIEENCEYASYIYIKTVTETRTTTYINPNVFGNNPLSWLWNVIFGGGLTKTVTTKVKVTKYTYREPKRGTANGSSPPINWFCIHKVVARLHTHAAYDPAYENDIFSPDDKRNAERQGIPTYVATPLGTLRKYDPSNGTDVVLFDDIPFDPNHPGR